MTDQAVSIIVPIHNRADVLTDTLRSIASQEGIDRCVLILVDNASTDGSQTVAANWIADNRQLFASAMLTHCTTPGAAAARNHGLRLVNTPWVMHFDSDDLMLPGLISSLLQTIDSGEYDIVSWDIMAARHNDIPRRVSGIVASRHLITDHLIHSTLATQRYAILTSLINEAGGWNESCAGWNDYELGGRLARLPLKIAHINKVMVEQRLCGNSITPRRFSDRPEVWQHALDCLSHTYADLPSALRWIDYRRVILAAQFHREGNRKSASTLLRNTIGSMPLRRRIIYHSIYLKHLIIPRGSHLLASLFFKRP